MKSSFISSSALQNAMMLTIRQSQNQLIKSTQESVTQTYADVGLSLGGFAARSVDFNREVSRIEALKDSNSTVSGRLESSQNSLDLMAKAAQDMFDKITALRGGQESGSIELSIDSAQAGLASMINAGNTMVNGEYLFAGINTDVQPLTDQSSTAIADIQTAFQTYWSTTLGHASASEVTGQEMEDFITNTVEPMFSAANWTDPTTGWSKASSQNMTSRINNSEVIESSTNANTDAMRYFALASMTTSALLDQGLGADALNAVSDKAISYSRQAMDGLTNVQGQLGLSQERVEKADDALDAQKNIIQNKIVDLVGVDQGEAATQVKTLQNQLETAYTLVSKIQQLSLVNYL